MAYENIEINHANFCISPIGGVFATIDYTNDDLLFYNDTGGTFGHSYDIPTGVSEIKSIEYTGPRYTGLSQAQLGTNLQFFSLEKTSATECVIKEWRLNESGSTLDLENSITKTTGGSYYFDCCDMAVEYYVTSFNGGTPSGVGYIAPSSIDNMEIGDKLLLGPSTDADPPINLHAMEWVEITAISGSTVYINNITFSGTDAPFYEYASGNSITFTKAIYLFSDIGAGNDSNGGIYKLHPYTGAVLDTDNSGIYHSNSYPSTWSAAAWSLDYDAIGFVRGSNLLYTNPNDNYELIRSHALTNIQSDDATLFEIYDLIFDAGNIYRLQLKTTRRDNYGVKTTSPWDYYNFQFDTISPYTLSVDITPESRAVVQHGGSITLNAVVRDQFGVGLLGKNVTFSSEETGGSFFPDPDRTTNSSGMATVTYTTDSYNYLTVTEDYEYIEISARADGSVEGITGSAYIWDDLEIILHKRFQFQRDLIRQISEEFSSTLRLNQIDDEFESTVKARVLTKFQFPGGHWTGVSPPSDTTTSIIQLEEFESDDFIQQIDDPFENEVHLNQLKDKTNTLQISQPFVSRHLTGGHIDTATIDQFVFVVDAIPAMFSEKNPVNTDIYLRVRPFGFDLDQNTVVFKVREVSYAGDTGYVDVTTASGMTIATFDAGGGLLGLDITYDPPVNFHYNAVVYVHLEVYDGAPTPNIIVLDYWFKVIPDFRAPYIDNESPAREEEDVSLSTNISFDLFDAEIGVDISTLEFYVNGRIKTPIYSEISGGYHISYDTPEDFFYGETVEIIVKVRDTSGNQLYDTWRFYCIGSTGPWIDPASFYPKACEEGIRRKTDYVSANVYAVDGTGVNADSIFMHVGGKDRNVKIIPIIYRIR